MTETSTSKSSSVRALVLNGRRAAASIRAKVATELDALLHESDTGEKPRSPQLVAVLVGDDPASAAYVGSKAKAATEVGILSKTLRFPSTVGRDELDAQIAKLNDDDEVDGILVQLPLPDHLPEREILDAIRPDKDVDGFHSVNVGRLWLGQKAPAPATPSGIITLLHQYQIPLVGSNAVIVGRSDIVGKPMAALLLREHCTVTICHSRTRDLPAVCRKADVLVAAIGRPGFIGDEHVGDGAVVVDVGINRIRDRALAERLLGTSPRKMARFQERGYALVGDVDYSAVAKRCAAITPVPGGVGPLTVAQLMRNTLDSYLQRT